MNLRVFGFDVEITMGFWLTVLLFSFMGGRAEWAMFFVWGFVLLVSVLIHELGHAVTYRAFGVRSSIRLHFLGGATFPNVILPLSRPKQVVVSLAGPFAGFALAGIVLLVSTLSTTTHPGFLATINTLLWVNIGWGILNLMPVLPLDGGHVVQYALGPKRYRITLGISALFGTILAILGGLGGHIFLTYIFGMSAFQSFIQLRETGRAVKASKEISEQVRAVAQPINPETVKVLKDARAALDNDEPGRAIELARSVIENQKTRPEARAVLEALTILGWSHLGRGETSAAADVVSRLTRMANADPALVAAVAVAKGDDQAARRLLEAARSGGDDRKEVFGPLIQVLLRQGEHARAAALAVDSAESISTDDLRTLAGMVSEGGAHHWAGKVHELIFRRDRDPNDAFEAARAYARAADPAKAIDLMRHAVQAGFTDSRRVYADEALVGIDELEHILPKPS